MKYRKPHQLIVKLSEVFSLLLLLGFISPVYAIDAMEEDDGINIRQIPLVDATGNNKNLDDYKGYYVLLNFMFTTCHDVCPVQTASLVQLQKKLDGSLKFEVHIVSITLDPEKDTAAELMKHAETYEIDTRTWSFLTGSPGDIRHITNRFTAIAPSDGADLKEHAPRVYLLDKEGNFLLSYRSDPLDVERVKADLIDLGS